MKSEVGKKLFEGFGIRVAIVLGSGINPCEWEFQRMGKADVREIMSRECVPAVEGHNPVVEWGEMGGVGVLVFHGRVHRYEGRSLEQIVGAVAVAAELGAELIVLTNAAGGLNPGFKVGDLMLVHDQIDLVFDSRTPMPRLEKPEPRQSVVYDPILKKNMLQAATRIGLDLKPGVYAGVPGPNYETGAEIRFLRAIGADAVGMSTVAEARFAALSGLRPVGLCCITNSNIPTVRLPLTHEEVVSESAKASRKLGILIREFFTRSFKSLLSP